MNVTHALRAVKAKIITAIGNFFVSHVENLWVWKKKICIYWPCIFLTVFWWALGQQDTLTWLSHVTNGDLEEIDLCRFFYDGAWTICLDSIVDQLGPVFKGPFAVPEYMKQSRPVAVASCLILRGKKLDLTGLENTSDEWCLKWCQKCDWYLIC